MRSALFRVAPLVSAILSVSGLVNAQTELLPSPEAYLGYRPGDDYRLTPWPEIVSYLELLAETSDRVVLRPLGRTTGDRPLVVLYLSSAENLAHLERIREIQAHLADPRTTSPGEAEALIEDGRVVVLLGCNIHSTEVASAELVMSLAYRLASTEDPTLLRVLDEVLVLLVPSLNPDGQILVTDWYYRTVGTPYEGTSPPLLYHPYVGHDNNRDWYMFTQVETRLVGRLLYHEWFPQVVYDLHQMGQKGARFFVPPFYDPLNPNLDPLLVRQIGLLGARMAFDLQRAGFAGVVDRAIYDTWWHGGMRTTPYRHNMVGILTEAASARLASPVFIDPDSLEGHDRGLPLYQAENNFPDPWPGGWWRLADIVAYEEAATLSLLEAVARDRRLYLGTFYELGRRAVAQGREEAPFGFVVPADQRDPGSAVRLLGALEMGGVEVERAETPFRLAGREIPAESYVVRLAQPFRAHAKDLLEVQVYPEEPAYSGGPQEPPYDITGWTLPLQMGVEVLTAREPLPVGLERAEEIVFPTASSPSGVPAYGYALAGGPSRVARAINWLLDQSVRVLRLERPAPGSARSWGESFFPVRDLPSRVLGTLMDSLEVVLEPLEESPAGEVRELRPPRIGLYRPWVPSIDAGWTRWVLEQFGFPYGDLRDAKIRAGGLAREWDVVVLPDMDPKDLRDGHPPGKMPPEYTGGLGERGLEALLTFVEEGGTVITLNRASLLVIDAWDLQVSVRVRPVEREAVFSGAGGGGQTFYAPGAILMALTDPRHPLAFGLPEQVPVFFENGPVFGTARGWTVVRLGDPPLMSGWLRGADEVTRAGLLIDYPLGEGRVVLFGFKPQHRAQAQGTFPFLFNAFYRSAAVPFGGL